MDLPIRTFFALVKQAGKLQAQERLDELRISAVPMFKFEFYAQMRAEYFKRMTAGDPVVEGRAAGLPEEPPPLRPSINAASQEARNQMIAIFKPMKRRYGKR